MTTYATQMWLLMMIGFAVGSLISLFAARVLLPKVSDLRRHGDTAASGAESGEAK